MTRRERLLFLLAVVIPRDQADQKLLTGVQQQYRQNALLGYMPTAYNRKTLYALLSRMEEDGLVQKSKLTDKTTVFITPRGIDALVHTYHHVGLQEKPWDGMWRIVMYDIAERDRYKREKIRITLEKFGFSSFQKSLYLSPYDSIAPLRTYLAQEGLLSFVTVFCARQEDFEDARGIADRVFSVNALGEAYHALLRRVQLVRGQQIRERKEIGLRKIRSEFVELLGHDPLLPKELLPSDWPFFQVRAALAEQ